MFARMSTVGMLSCCQANTTLWLCVIERHGGGGGGVLVAVGLS